MFKKIGVWLVSILFFVLGPLFGAIAAIEQIRKGCPWYLIYGYALTIMVAGLVILIFTGITIDSSLSFFSTDKGVAERIFPKTIDSSCEIHALQPNLANHNLPGHNCPHNDGGTLEIMCLGHCSRFVACTVNRINHRRPATIAEGLHFPLSEPMASESIKS